MTHEIRVLTEAGMDRFAEMLRAWREGGTDNIPPGMLTDSPLSAPLGAEAVIEAPAHTASKMEMIHSVANALQPVPRVLVDGNSGLWTWLSLLLVDLLCPTNESGLRTVGADERYIPSTDFRRFYRQLVLGPFGVYRLHGDDCRVLLHGPPSKLGDFMEQIASRQERVTSSAVIGALDRLYYDSSTGNLRRGATNRRKPGTLRRFLVVLDQLDRTYDLFGLTGDELRNLLPAEFDRWDEIDVQQSAVAASETDEEAEHIVESTVSRIGELAGGELTTSSGR